MIQKLKIENLKLNLVKLIQFNKIKLIYLIIFKIFYEIENM